MNRLRKYFHISFRDKMLLAKALIVVLGIRFALFVFPFNRVLAWLNRRQQRSAELSEGTGLGIKREQEKIVWAVRAIARHLLVRKPCLVQALAVKWLLGRRGKQSELQIGVIKAPDEKLEAHAWLRVDGDIIIGGTRSPFLYTPLSPLDKAANYPQS